MNKLLVIGAGGQLGSELTKALVNTHGSDAVIATDFQESVKSKFAYCRFKTLDVLDKDAIANLIQEEKITQVYHLAAILSANGEKNPVQAWDINMQGLLNVLDLAKEMKLDKVFWPSSIAVFGPNSPKSNTPQDAFKNPTTVYGISKLAGEHWCEYYFNTYGVDVRSLRFPGLIGYKSLPGGGTTDYAVDIYYKAVNKEPFTCFLKEDTALPMMYMEDAVQATLQLMAAPASNIQIRTSYNLAGMSFSPKEIAESIRSHYPEFSLTYAPDFRQKIADSWPSSINDDCARNDWGWKALYDLPKMTTEILTKLPQNLK
ncbi:NAD-dependent epimerase/dehydratase family protein [Aquirufa sp.]|jgi:nucleoside-diphosphate-sugar epimerase|uniref:NAD-dependent epimerase/dehydratase family protein n=1 Tax=Aquirufa sp. TaxID=2676249 RepID=UPI0037848C6D